MGKSKNQKREMLRRAARMRSEYRKWLFIFFGVLIVCLVAIFIYMQLSMAGTFPDMGIMPWVTAVVAAGALGVLSNKFSKLHRQYEGTLDKYKITDEDVKEYLKERKEQS